MIPVDSVCLSNKNKGCLIYAFKYCSYTKANIKEVNFSVYLFKNYF